MAETLKFIEYSPRFLDYNDREGKKMGKSRYFTREYGLMPKTGDLMEVEVGNISSNSYFVPVRMTREACNKRNSADFTLDMMDVLREGIMPALITTEKYNSFREFVLPNQETEKLKAENVFGEFKLILVDKDLQVIYEQRRKFFDNVALTGLFAFIPGRMPFSERFKSEESIGGVAGIPLENLMVNAVLHPMYGLPKILLQQVKEAKAWWNDDQVKVIV